MEEHCLSKRKFIVNFTEDLKSRSKKSKKNKKKNQTEPQSPACYKPRFWGWETEKSYKLNEKQLENAIRFAYEI